MAKREIYVERRPEGDYAVRRPGSERASAIEPTQAKAIERARELAPNAAVHVERLRNSREHNPVRVFLSYTQADQAFAKALSQELTRRGLDVWSDEQKILPGDNWGASIAEALRRSKAMVVLISPDSMRSKFVRSEIQYALGDLGYEQRIFPVMVEETSSVPWILNKFIILD